MTPGDAVSNTNVQTDSGPRGRGGVEPVTADGVASVRIPESESGAWKAQIRPIRRDDWRALRQFHSRLSPTTVSLRFHAAKRELTEPLAHRFTELDGYDEFALVATHKSDGRIVGVARYSRLAHDSAEVAFVVEDAYQGHGIGSRLLDQLREHALAIGITKFVAEVLPGNTPMLHLLAEAGEATSRFEGNECEVTVDLTRGKCNERSEETEHITYVAGRSSYASPFIMRQ